MSLAPGTRLGPYTLVSVLGTGGMGEVYRARDTRLGREVAIKVSAPGRLADPKTAARFLSETAIAARLTHPRICTVYDAGNEAGRQYVAMELLHGETLATRLDRAAGRGLAPHEALDIASGICEALTFAHRNGVVHGDVKPSNIMLTRDGVKLLDFGVARLRDPEPTAASTDVAGLPTVELSVVGTPAYMAPEQIDGRTDPRSDLFALGAVLYEMLTGHRAFPGETSSDVLAAVVRCQPVPLEDLAADLPAAITRVVHRCLQRNVDERWQSAADLGEALAWAKDPLSLVGSAPSRRRTATRWARGLWLAAATLAIGIAAVSFGRNTTAEAPSEFYIDDVPLPDGQRFLPGHTSWSSDGRRVAVVTQASSGSRLWIREIGRSSDWLLVDGAGAEFVTYPSWSPDSQSLAYFRDRMLVRRSLSAASPVALAEAPDGRGTTWLGGSTILFAPESQGDIWQIPASGGTANVLIRRQPDDLGVKFPEALEDGQILYWAQRSNQADSEVRTTSPQAPDTSRTIVRSSKAAAYADGHLFFVRDNILVAQQIDRHTLTLRGRAEPLPVELGLGGHLGAPFVTAGGQVAGVQSVRRETKELTWVDRTGRTLGTLGDVGAYRTMSLSPDGGQLLVEQAAPGLDTASIWLVDVRTGATRRLATDVGASLPVWHPSAARVAFRASTGPGGSGAVQTLELETDTREAAVEVFASARPAGWTPNGDLVWWAGDVSGRFNGIFVRTPDRDDRTYRTIRVGAEARAVAVRPDGAAIAYSSNESGAFEIYVDTYPSSRGTPWKVSSGGGNVPRWSPDGRELFFVSGGSLLVVDMTGPDGGPSGTPHQLFPIDGGDYGVHADGRLLIQRGRRPQAHYLRILRNWSQRPAAEVLAERP